MAAVYQELHGLALTLDLNESKIMSGTAGESAVGQLLKGNFIQIQKDKQTPKWKVKSQEMNLNHEGETTSNQREEKFLKSAERIE